MQEVEIDANSDLVQLLKKGGVRVTKKSLKERYGGDKKAIIRQTLKHPEALVAYKKAKEREPHLPLTHEAIAQLENQPGPDWEKLLNDVLKCEPGNKMQIDTRSRRGATHGTLLPRTHESHCPT
jgi:hypothetical protein